MPYQEPNYEAAFAMDMTGVPGALESFMPLIIPIILILINTVATAMGKTEGFMNILVFLGQPIVAVGLGLIVAILTLGRSLDRHEALAEMEKGMASAGIIMLVTGEAEPSARSSKIPDLEHLWQKDLQRQRSRSLSCRF